MSNISPITERLRPESLEKIRLRIIDVPQIQVFKSAIGERRSRKALIVELESASGKIGYGECSCRPDPFYSHEFVDGAVQVLKSFIIPSLQKTLSYSELLKINHRIRGWNFTKAAVEFAFNDLIRRESGDDLLSLSEFDGLDKVPVGISLGLFDSQEAMSSKVNEAIEEGYQRIKFKINPEYGSEEILAALEGVGHDNISLDANGSFGEEQFDELERFASLGYIIEQPFYLGSEYLQKTYHEQGREPLRMCLDEDIESYGNLLSYNERIEQVNIKPGRIGGLFESLRMIQYCKSVDLDAWIGGMFETGIGRAQNLRIASILHSARAHDLSPSSRYFKKDVLTRPIEMEQGYIDKEYFDNVDIDLSALDDLTEELFEFNINND